jgi:hypothetical protein
MIPLEWMPPLMFTGLIVIMLIGYPVAFSLSRWADFGYRDLSGFFEFSFLQAIPGRIFGSILANELLLAIPFFTFMGAILEKCGLAEDMLDSMGQLFGTVRGGVGYSVIIVGFILGAITGTVAAQVIAMALISLPVMMRYKYNMRYATGVLAASGTITQLVPPSLVLVVLADQLGRSVGDMYLGAWGPSILQVLLFALFTFAVSIVKPHWVPAIPKTDLSLHGWALWKKCLWGIIPPRAHLPGARHAAAGPRHADGGRRDGLHRRHRSRGHPAPAARRRGQADRVDRRHRRRRRGDRRRLGVQVGPLQGRHSRSLPCGRLPVRSRRDDQRPAQAHRGRVRGDDAADRRWSSSS